MKHIHVKPLPASNQYVLLQSVIIEKISVYEGFKWNGASIPSPFWPLIGSPFNPKFMVASMVHDYLYRTRKACDIYGRTIHRKEADKIFKKLLIHDGVDLELAETMYTAVRLGGQNSWKE
jgi:hypothetical protein